MLVPRYVQDDPALARVLDESMPTRCAKRSRQDGQDLMPRQPPRLPVVNPDDTVLEIAAIMAANRSPLVAVVEERSKTAALSGAISAAQLLGRILPVS